MRKLSVLFVLFALCAFVVTGSVDAATTGKAQGTVRDAQTGEPLPGANVVLEGTQRGAVTDANGYYVILLVDPGMYTMKASMVGYDAQTKTDVKVQTDFTSTVDFAIRETALQLGEMVVVAEAPPVEPDKTTSKYMMSTEDLEAVPIVREMTDFVELQAGVSIDEDGNDIKIRAGDRNDVAYVIDGVRVNTTDHRGTRTGLGRNINKGAIQELTVITGGYNAEYGNAQGGVVSMVTRDGGSAYHGMGDYQFTPSGQKHWGADAYESTMYRGNNKWDDPNWVAEQVTLPNGETVQAHQRLDYTEELGHRLEGQVSGPLTKDLTFFVTSRWRRRAASLPNVNLTTPFNTSNTAKLTYAVSPNLKLRVGGVYDKRDGTFGGPTQGGRLDMRDSGRNVFLSLPDPTGNYTDTDAMYYLGVTHSLSPKTFYEVRLGYSTTVRDTSDLRFQLTSNRTTDAGGYFTVYRETSNWSKYEYKRLSLKGDLSSQVNKQNFVKAGFEMIRYNNWYQQFWSNGPTHRNVRYFAKDYASTAFWPNTDNTGLNPMELGFYIQDKIEFEGMIVNVGLREGFFFQNTWMKDNDAWNGQLSTWHSMTRQAIVPEVKGPKIDTFQPRVGVSHPITEKSLVRFFYGRFTQRPQFHEMFEYEYQSREATDTDLNGNGVIDPAEEYNEFDDPSQRYGTRKLFPEETTSFEVGLDWNFVGDYVFGLTTYYKSSGNEIVGASQEWRNPEQHAYTTGGRGYANGNWKDARGFEINLKKKFSNMFAFNLGYNLQWADGGRNSAHRRDVFPDSLWVASYYFVDYDVDPTTGAEIPVGIQERARRDGKTDANGNPDLDFYVREWGHNANGRIDSQNNGIENYSSSAWIPWYSHYAAGGLPLNREFPPELDHYRDEDREYWERVGADPRWPNEVSGPREGNLLVWHNQESGERRPLGADRRSFGSITFLFATPADYGPMAGKALGSLRANLVYRLYTGARFTYSTGGIQGFRYGPIHTRMDFNAEKVFGSTSGMNMTLAVEVFNLFAQKDNRQNSIGGIPEDWNSDRWQQYGITALNPTSPDIANLNLKNAEVNDIGNYWDQPREMTFSVRVKW